MPPTAFSQAQGKSTMDKFRLGRLATISIASLLFIACDDDTAGDSQNGSGGSSGVDSNSSDPGSTSDPSSAGSNSASGSTTSSTSETGGMNSGSEGTAADGGGSESSGTTGGEPGTTTDAGGSESSTGRDDAGESSTGEDSDSGVIEICEAPGDLTPCDSDTTDPFQAMGLGCVGGPNEAIQIYNDIFISDDPDAWKIVRQYGTHIDPTDGLPTWRPREGETMLMVSTGVLPDPDMNGVITQAAGNGGANDNVDSSPLPAPMSPLSGSNAGAGGTPFLGCDDVNDCSDSMIDQWNLGDSEANDLLWFQFEVPVPGGTYGFQFDFAYFSAEFPEFVNDTYNDMFAVWSDSESYTGNLCFVNDQPCTVTALWPTQFATGDDVLEGTMFDNLGFTEGEATGWFEAKGSTVPNELLQLTFAVFDMGDTAYDTIVLIDNFQWDCEGCTPSEVDPCIGIDPI